MYIAEGFSSTCAEVLIGHTWFPYFSEARFEPCAYVYIPNLQSNFKKESKNLQPEMLRGKSGVSIRSQTFLTREI